MKIHSIGYHYREKPSFFIHRPHGIDSYLLLLILTPAFFELNGERILTKPNCMILFDKMSPQLYGAVNQPFCNDFIHFEFEDKTEQSYVSSILSFDTIYEIPTMELISRKIRELSFEHLSANSKKEESMQLILKLLFFKIEEQLKANESSTPYSPYYHDLLSLRSYIYNSVEKKHSIEELANRVDLSPSHFHALYKKTFGISCIQDVITSKIEFAKYHLTQTGYQVKEIATLCGYDNEVHFMRQFKKLTGYTPKEYRNKVLHKN
ncbi:AraC family transcriptional regulator [Anaerosporobacter sp.]|uniref:AraC family transcriptional regulator n=1 Tax=Anaerosporobacter sp. TaxID=1872529 RepID=UPI00286F3447|nr:AraC family transcriptional regulator [Anaerosporobacter sp.]